MAPLRAAQKMRKICNVLRLINAKRTFARTYKGAKDRAYRVFRKFVDILKSLYFIQISYISLHFLADINKSYCLSIFRTFV